MPASDYLAGLLFFVPTLAGSLGGAWLLLSKRYPQLGGAERAVAFATLSILGLLAVHLLPAALGVLSRSTVVAAAALWLVGASLVPAVRRPLELPPEPAGRVTPLGRLLAAAAVILALLFALAIARDRLFLAPGAVDTLNFHLPSVIAWIQQGSIWQIDVFLPDVAPGHYPNNGDVLLLAAVLPWSNDFLAHLALYPVWALTGLAVYALARELRAPREAAAAAAALLVVMPVVIVPALVSGYTDILALFGLAAGLLFGARWHRTGFTSEFVLAGLALGVAFGTKWYGVSAVAVVVGVWTLAALRSGREARALARQGGLLVGLIVLAGGIWMFRNWVISGNPVFPVRVAPLGVEVFDAPLDVVRERGGFTLAGYLDQPRLWWESILPQYRDVIALPGMILLGGLVVSAILLIGRRASQAPARPLARWALLAAGLILLVYLITPYSAGGPEGRPILAGSDSRYGLPALVIAAALCAWVAARFPSGIAVLSGLTLLAILDSLVQVSDSSLSGAAVDRRDWLAAIAVVLALWAVIWFVPPRWAALGSGGRRGALIATGCAALLVVTIGGYQTQKRFNGVRYVDRDPTVDYILGPAGSGLRVGLAGVWDNGIPPVLPAFGPRLDNEVAYVGWEDGGFLRRYRDRDSFVAALRRGDYDYLYLGRGIPPRPRPKTLRWARSAGYREVAISNRLTLLSSPPAR